jgi:hypothetical protein
MLAREVKDDEVLPTNNKGYGMVVLNRFISTFCRLM